MNILYSEKKKEKLNRNDKIMSEIISSCKSDFCPLEKKAAQFAEN